ncbi:MAG: hypothetical protein PHQ12_14995 [Chthoniobacteraceae bacterium]|nr:hypothetical protein [Chthoniobacteraceae bacterium]
MSEATTLDTPKLTLQPSEPEARAQALEPRRPFANARTGKLVEVLGVLGWHFGGMLKRGRGWRLHFWREQIPPEAVTIPNAGLRAFAVRELRKIKP